MIYLHIRSALYTVEKSDAEIQVLRTMTPTAQPILKANEKKNKTFMNKHIFRLNNNATIKLHQQRYRKRSHRDLYACFFFFSNTSRIESAHSFRFHYDAMNSLSGILFTWQIAYVYS